MGVHTLSPISVYFFQPMKSVISPVGFVYFRSKGLFPSGGSAEELLRGSEPYVERPSGGSYEELYAQARRQSALFDPMEAVDASSDKQRRRKTGPRNVNRMLVLPSL